MGHSIDSTPGEVDVNEATGSKIMNLSATGPDGARLPHNRIAHKAFILGFEIGATDTQLDWPAIKHVKSLGKAVTDAFLDGLDTGVEARLKAWHAARLCQHGPSPGWKPRYSRAPSWNLDDP